MLLSVSCKGRLPVSLLTSPTSKCLCYYLVHRLVFPFIANCQQFTYGVEEQDAAVGEDARRQLQDVNDAGVRVHPGDGEQEVRLATLLPPPPLLTHAISFGMAGGLVDDSQQRHV